VQLLGRFTRCKHEPHRLSPQTPSHKPERQRRGLIQPLRVVNDAKQWTLLGRLGQEGEHSQANQERIRCRPCAQAEDNLECVTLWSGEPLERIEQR
jgi:hypothetical protein